MKKLCIILSATLLLPFTFLCSGCNKNYSEDLFCFGSPVKIVTDAKISDQLLTNISNAISRLDREFSVSNGSFTTAFNNATKGEEIELSENALTLISACKQAYAYTNKKFNPAVYPLVKLWGFSPNYNGQFAPPSSEQISQILTSGMLEFDNVIIDNENKTIYKTNQNTQLDFGGILKGYATDYIANTLYDNGFRKGFVSIGSSSLKILGTSSLAIRHPIELDKSIIKIDFSNLENVSVSTSGTYEKIHQYEGISYSHIIDTKTGLSLQNKGIISATVIGVDGIKNDTLTTALCLCEYNCQNKNGELVDFMNKIQNDFPNSQIYVFYSDNGVKQLLTNQKESEAFTLLDNTFTVVNI